jgi:hypothetical protein
MAIRTGFTSSLFGGKIKQIVEGPSTNTLLIIGTAQDGPLNSPVRITDGTQAERVFGPANYSKGYLDPTTGTESNKYAGSTLPLAIAQAIAAGARDIVAVRASGTKATVTLGGGGYLTGVARNPGRIYNTQSVSLGIVGDLYTFTLTQPLTKGGNLVLTGSASGTTLGEFIIRVNTNFANKSIDFNDTSATVNPYLASTLSSIYAATSGTANFTGGTNGCFARGETYGPEHFTTSGSGLFDYALGLVNATTGTFQSIRDSRYPFDVAVLTGVHVDDQVTAGGNATSTSLLNDFADFIDAVSSEQTQCHGVMATRSNPLRDNADIITYANDSLLATSYGYYRQASKWIKAGPILATGRTRSGTNGTLKDVFSNVSVVAGPDVIYNHPDMGGDYNYQPHVSYAAFLTTIPPEQSTTQRTLPGIKGYTRPFPQSTAVLLGNGVGADLNNNVSGGGAYVVLVRDQISPLGPLVINDDVTASARDDFFRNYQQMNMCASIQKDIQVALRPFIGQTLGYGTQAAMEAKVENVLAGYALSGGLRGSRGEGYDFSIEMAGTEAALGIVTVLLELALSSAIRQIKLNVSVRQVD